MKSIMKSVIAILMAIVIASASVCTALAGGNQQRTPQRILSDLADEYGWAYRMHENGDAEIRSGYHSGDFDEFSFTPGLYYSAAINCIAYTLYFTFPEALWGDSSVKYDSTMIINDYNTWIISEGAGSAQYGDGIFFMAGSSLSRLFDEVEVAGEFEPKSYRGVWWLIILETQGRPLYAEYTMSAEERMEISKAMYAMWDFQERMNYQTETTQFTSDASYVQLYEGNLMEDMVAAMEEEEATAQEQEEYADGELVGNDMWGGFR